MMTGKHRWVAGVMTESTFPPEGLFKKDAATIARTLASKKVSPKGPASGMRTLVYFINRGGRGLSKTRRAVLERAKRLLSARIRTASAGEARGLKTTEYPAAGVIRLTCRAWRHDEVAGGDLRAAPDGVRP